MGNTYVQIKLTHINHILLQLCVHCLNISSIKMFLFIQLRNSRDCFFFFFWNNLATRTCTDRPQVPFWALTRGVPFLQYIFFIIISLCLTIAFKFQQTLVREKTYLIFDWNEAVGDKVSTDCTVVQQHTNCSVDKHLSRKKSFRRLKVWRVVIWALLYSACHCKDCKSILTALFSST